MSEEQKINVEQVVQFLSRAFSNAMNKASNVLGRDNSRGTKLYEYQVEFCYLVDEILRGPVYIVPVHIQSANELIAKLEQEGKALSKS